jgi:hypothetical protein
VTIKQQVREVFQRLEELRRSQQIPENARDALLCGFSAAAALYGWTWWEVAFTGWQYAVDNIQPPYCSG